MMLIHGDSQILKRAIFTKLVDLMYLVFQLNIKRLRPNVVVLHVKQKEL